MFLNEDLNKQLREARKLLKKKKAVPTGLFGVNHRLCKKFKHDYASSSREAKLDALRVLSNQVIENLIPYARRRAKKHPGNGKLCWVCKDARATCQHHIVQLQNGGFDNGINRIPICNECHIEIHDWMADKVILETWEGEYNYRWIRNEDPNGT